MKHFTILFLLTVCLQIAAFSQQKITLQEEKQEISKVLKEIEKQSGYTFSYNPTLIKELPAVSVNVKEESLQNVLEQIFAKTNILFIIESRYIILKKRPEKITISGYIYDKDSHETLIGGNVYDTASQQGAVSNNFGFYSLTAPPGSLQLRTSYVGYVSEPVSVTVEKDTMIHFFLKPPPLLHEVVVEGKYLEPFKNVETGKITLNTATIQKIPSFMGEKDVIKALQQMPGVAAGTDGVAGMYVRGGNADENLYMVDGNPIYHVNHLLGIFSAFNPEAVKKMDFYRGSFPARYGGRLSSVVDVRMNDGDMKAFNGTVSIGLISSRINFQGPIIKDKTSFTISLRRTYLDLIGRPILYFYNKRKRRENPDNYENTDVGYYFYDFNAKINHKFSEKSRLFLSIYDGKDRFFLNHKQKEKETDVYSSIFSDIENETKSDIEQHTKHKFGMSWGTRLVSLNWAHEVNNKLFSNATFVYSRYASNISSLSDTHQTRMLKGDAGAQAKEFSLKDDYKTFYRSGIEDLGCRLDFDYTPTGNHSVKFGASLLHHGFRPEESRIVSSLINEREKRNDTINFANSYIKVKDVSFYLEDEMNLTENLKVNAGVHFSGFFVQGKSYLSLQPRLSARYLFSDRWSVKASYGKMNQYVHLLQNSSLSLPNDLWVPITKNIKPLVSHQFSTGIFGKYKNIDLSLEGYYKTSQNQVEYKEGVDILTSNLYWEDRVAQGNGESYGVELLARKTLGNTSGWVGYTLSWAKRRFANGEINNGKMFPSKYDNRHKINLMVTHTFNKRFDVSASWTYSSGNWTTLPMEKYIDMNGVEKNYIHQRNNFKMPAYHRMDLSFNYYRHKKNGRMGILNLSLYNVYSRQNTFTLIPTNKTIVESENGKEVLTGNQSGYRNIYIFPIMPSISYTYIF